MLRVLLRNSIHTKKELHMKKEQKITQKDTKGSMMIEIPSNVEVSLLHNTLAIHGPLGTLSLCLDAFDPNACCSLKIEDNQLHLRSLRAPGVQLKSQLMSAFIGVTRGFVQFLQFVGVGYRARIEESDSGPVLDLKLGQTHQLLYTPPANVRLFLLKPTLLCVLGVSKEQVGLVAANIRKLKEPEPYKGKGICYLHENVRRKEGKKK